MKWTHVFLFMLGLTASTARYLSSPFPDGSENPVVALMALNAPVILWLMPDLDGFGTRPGTVRPGSNDIAPNGDFHMKTRSDRGRRIPVATTSSKSTRICAQLAFLLVVTVTAFGQDRETDPLANACRPLSIVLDIRGDVVEPNAVRDVVEQRLRSARLYDSDAETALVLNVYAFPTMARVTPAFRRRPGQPLVAASEAGLSLEVTGGRLTDDRALSVVGQVVDRFLLNYLRANEETCE